MNVTKKDKLYVFAVPHTLEFYLDETIKEAKSFSLMNCYEFPVKFKILWNTQNKYYVTPTECVMQPTKMGQCFVKYVPGPGSPTNFNAEDNLVILMYDCSTNKILGKGSVKVQLFPHRKSVAEGSPTNTPSETKPSQQILSPETSSTVTRHPLRALIILGAMSFILSLPVAGENTGSVVPSFLHVSHTCKVFFAYVFGFLSCLIICNKQI